MKEQPNYYSIIPANVRYDDSLKANEKLLYGEITALANKNGYCWAENKYFANLYDVKKGTVSGWISNLEKRGYITTKLIYGANKQVKERRIYLTNTLYDKNHIPYAKKDAYPIREKSQEELNNTSINTTSNNKEHSPADAEPPIPFKEIVDYLNKKADRNFRHSTDKTKRLIKARYNEGFEIEDFKKVIDIKAGQWKGQTEMEKYLRPETLFGTKFEGYLNEQFVNTGKGKDWDDWEF